MLIYVGDPKKLVLISAKECWTDDCLTVRMRTSRSRTVVPCPLICATFRVDLSNSNDLIKKIPHRVPSSSIPDTVTLTTTISYHKVILLLNILRWTI